jgi:hypothetical protein
MYGNAAALEEYQYKWFELLVEYYVGDGGLKWERCIVHAKQNKQTDSAPWTDFEIPPKEIVHNVVAFDKMEIGKINYNVLSLICTGKMKTENFVAFKLQNQRIIQN